MRDALYGDLGHTLMDLLLSAPRWLPGLCAKSLGLAIRPLQIFDTVRSPFNVASDTVP